MILPLLEVLADGQVADPDETARSTAAVAATAAPGDGEAAAIGRIERDVR